MECPAGMMPPGFCQAHSLFSPCNQALGLLEAGMASQKNEVSAINTRGEGDSHADMTGMLVEIFKSNP